MQPSKMEKKRKMITCPKCKSNGDKINLVEHWSDHVIEFEQNQDGTINPYGYLRDGSPYKVVAECFNCRHRWRLRGISQITNLNIQEGLVKRGGR
jgi:hypothetical protein